MVMVWLWSVLFGVLAFTASYCYGVINNQDHLIARSLLWSVGTFAMFIIFGSLNQLDFNDDDEKEEEDDD